MSNKKLHKGISLDYRKALEDEVFYYAEGNLDCIGLVNISDVKTNHPTPEQIGKVLGRAYRLWREHCIKCGIYLRTCRYACNGDRRCSTCHRMCEDL